jgi:hypothetical protein
MTPAQAHHLLAAFLHSEQVRRQRLATGSYSSALWTAVRDAEDAAQALEILRQRASVPTGAEPSQQPRLF